MSRELNSPFRLPDDDEVKNCKHHNVVDFKIKIIDDRIEKIERKHEDMSKEIDQRISDTEKFCDRLEASWKSAYLTLSIIVGACALVGGFLVKLLNHV